MRILVTGATGLIGKALLNRLPKEGHEAVGLVRHKGMISGPVIEWDPENSVIDKAGLEGIEGVVHLAGENIASGRWTPDKKRRILESRVQGTRFLCEALSGLTAPPRVLVSASAIGYYGDRGEEILEENSGAGTGFLAEVCQQWEAAAVIAEKAGIRVVRLRLGVVLSEEGGALAKMATPFRLGLGGVIGNGRAYMSWITLEDVLRVIGLALAREEIRGVVNATAPNPVTNREFTAAIGKALHRPAMFPMPAWAVRLVFGEMGREMLLASTRVMPGRLTGMGFVFQYPSLDTALGHVLKKDVKR
ncbi:MAG TPA: TIGR01777 family oxidoreductase [Candidatus Hydrogenedentes bacterium]|nr:TIGR01777 family oxidoreductase [Candidatus Hydrogenedentota bacterium]